MKSALDEGFPVIVVVDGKDVKLPADANRIISESPRVKLVRLGRTWGEYGGAAANTGAYLAETPFVTFLDDDDEYFEGAGQHMRECVAAAPEVDIWIPGLRFNNGMELCLNGEKGVNMGNVACPTMRTEMFWRLPFQELPPVYQDNLEYTDFFQILTLDQMGAIVDWFEKVLINVRPHLPGTNGRGQ